MLSRRTSEIVWTNFRFFLARWLTYCFLVSWVPMFLNLRLIMMVGEGGRSDDCVGKIGADSAVLGRGASADTPSIQSECCQQFECYVSMFYGGSGFGPSS
ncbi:uncharacterized protein G2W53_009305 [Senna tora]|uniref:Uncharacterized protein n=1 Tax=Senna tora TaxID=362788 RepID=A0A835C7Q8_9FABA|nr:uncharacterized protein G2W53_009305 [Senna tora]